MASTVRRRAAARTGSLDPGAEAITPPGGVEHLGRVWKRCGLGSGRIAVTRSIPTLGLIGAPLLLTANLLTFFGHNTQTSGWTLLATVPIFVWELSVGVYMTVKGFKPTAAPEPSAA